MSGWTDVREAARIGIDCAGYKADLAESWPARDASPRTACLDRVQQAEAIVLVLGTRYGTEGPSGLSATEEEYNEARVRAKPVFVFVQRGAREGEVKQRKFIDRVGDYRHGRYWKEFDTPGDLARHVAEALRQRLPARSLRREVVERRLATELHQRPVEDYRDKVWMKIAWTTTRGDQVFDRVALANSDLVRRIRRGGRACEMALLTSEKPDVGWLPSGHLRIAQRGNDPEAVVTVHPSGMLAVANVLEREATTDADVIFFDVENIEQDILRERLMGAWRFSAMLWDELDPDRRHESLVYGVALFDVGDRKLARYADLRPGHNLSVNMMTCPHDPLMVDTNRPVSRIALDRPDEAIDHIIAMASIRFSEW